MAIKKKIRGSAGHGKGSEWNRGGVLFNEGDENLVFTNLLFSNLERYDVDAREIRNEKGNYNWDNTKYRSPYGNGAELYYSSHSNAEAKGNTASGVEAILSLQSLQYRDFAEGLVKLIAETLNIPNRGVKYRALKASGEGWITYSEAKSGKYVDNWYAELRGNKAKCAILVEHFFHTNPTDSKKYLSKRSELAKKIADYIASYFKLELKAGAKTVANNKDLNQLYRVQVGAFKERLNAEKLVKDLEVLGYKPFIASSIDSVTRKTDNEIADEVIAGKWGNNPERKKKIIEAGYNYDNIQSIVNRKTR